MTGSEIFARARKAQLERAGVRSKVRVPSELWHRVRLCADACHASAEDYVCAACRRAADGRLRVPPRENTQKGTREDSETVWIRTPAGFDTAAENLRPILLAAVEHTEARVKPQPCILVEGVDYLVEGRNYSRVTARGIA